MRQGFQKKNFLGRACLFSHTYRFTNKKRELPKSVTNLDLIEDFPYWEPCHEIILGNGIMGWENVGTDLDEANGKRVTIAGWPIKWKGGDGSMVRLVAMVDEGDQ